ncbi:hypothetical protein ACLB2K_053062 [Fragaria x ananassa]
MSVVATMKHIPDPMTTAPADRVSTGPRVYSWTIPLTKRTRVRFCCWITYPADKKNNGRDSVVGEILIAKITPGGSSRLALMLATSPLIPSRSSRLASMQATSPLIPGGSSRFSHMQNHLHESYLALHPCKLPRLTPGGSSRLATLRAISLLNPGGLCRIAPLRAISLPEKSSNNLAKFVVILWVFVVLILTSTYTATLASLMTVKQIQLNSRGNYIGYQSVSLGVILNLNFTGLKPYRSSGEYLAALSKGSKHNGVSGIIDEVPYINIRKIFC